MVDPNGVVIDMTYDALGRPLKTTIRGIAECDMTRDPLCATDITVTSRCYTGAGRLSTDEKPGGVTAYTYDSRGRIQTISRGPSANDLRERIEYTYDPLTGNKSTERTLGFESGAWTEKRRESFTYDTAGRLTKLTHTDGTEVHYSYDPGGVLTSVRDENHSEPNTYYAYDGGRRLREVQQRLASAPGGLISTQYTYDAQGNLASVTDPNGNVTTANFDDFGEAVSQLSPVTGLMTHAYDDVGNLVATIDANGATVTRTYDVLGRVTSTTSTRGTVPPEIVTWTYDEGAFGTGRVSSMTDPTGSTAYTYDRRGLLLSEAKTILGVIYRTRYGYDAAGNRARIGYPSGRSVTYAFDYAGRPMTAATGGTALVASSSYLPFGPLTELVFGNGTTRRMTYDDRYRPLTNELSAFGALIASYAYVHDPVGNVTQIRDTIDPSFDRGFSYDDLHRLTGTTSGDALWRFGSWTYDAMGNMKSAALGASRNTTFTYTGTTPKLTAITENGRDQAVRYDTAGNEIAAGPITYEYSPRNHLSRQGTTTYGYDGRWLRVITTRPAALSAFSITPSSIPSGSTAEGSVTLSAPAPAEGAVVALTSNSSIVSLPGSVTVASGQTTGTFIVATATISGEADAIITASYNGSQRNVTVKVTGSRFDGMSITPSSVTGGETAQGTIQLAAPAGEDSLVMQLRSSSPTITVPESVTIRGERDRATFSIATRPVSAPTQARISATLGAEIRDATLTILPSTVISLAFAPSSLRGGSQTTATISLTGAAPEGGMRITLRSTSTMLSVPPSVAIASGARSVTFSASARPVEVETVVEVTASVEEAAVEITGAVIIQPPALAAFSVTPASVVGGDHLSAEVAIDAPAAEEGARAELSASDPDLVGTPAHVEIPAGATSHTLTLTTAPVAVVTPVVVSATRAGITRSSTVTLTPPPVTIKSFVLASTAVVGTNDVSATVTLTDAAPIGGTEVELSTSAPTLTSVASAIIVPAGETKATVVIATSLVTAPSDVVITALHATTEKHAGLTLLPPTGNYVSGLTITPAFVVGGTNASGTLTLAFPAAHGASVEVQLLSDGTFISMPSSVKIPPNATSAEFIIATTTVAEPHQVTLTASYGGVLQRAHMVVAPRNAITIKSLGVTPERLPPSEIATGLVTLTAPAPFGGASVSITSRRHNIVNVPATVVVPQGAATTTFAVYAEPLHGKKERSTEIVAAYNGLEVTTTVTVAPPSAESSTTPKPIALCASASLEPCMTRAAASIGATSTLQGERQFHLYTPQLGLLAEATQSADTPALAYEYVWFGTLPLAQIETATSAVHYYFTDFLGTPLMQTDAAAQIVWQAEYEPYGGIYALRHGESKHQPLRLPGQVAGDDTPNLHQNVFRWYRAGQGRYTQTDPIGLGGGLNLYTYTAGNPLVRIDPLGKVSFNVGPAKYVPGTWDETIANCNGAYVYGCTMLTGKIGCSCSCSADDWLASISISTQHTVFYATNTSIPGAHIMKEEQKHVKEDIVRLETIKKEALKIEAKTYPFKALCEAECKAFEIWSFTTLWFSSIYTHVTDPHDYPK